MSTGVLTIVELVKNETIQMNFSQKNEIDFNAIQYNPFNLHLLAQEIE